MARLYYFAYGSNMSLARLRQRAPSAECMGRYSLPGHALHFHKSGRDGSGKCDAYWTGREHDRVLGGLFTLDDADKAALDAAEGLGNGYDEKQVGVFSEDNTATSACTYIATAIDSTLKRYSWYRLHVLIGARELALPVSYVRALENVPVIEDPDRQRDKSQRAIHQQKD